MKSDRDLIDDAQRDIDLLQRFLSELRHVRSDFYLWAEIGFPSGSDGAGRSNGHSDSPYAHAQRERDRELLNVKLVEKGLMPRRASFEVEMAREYASIEDNLALIHNAALRLERLRQLATTTRAVTQGAEGCTSCARLIVTDIDGKRGPYWSPVWDKCKGRRLCRWCSQFLDDWGVLPAVGLVDLRRQSKTITTRTIRDTMPELAEELDKRQRRKAS